MTTKHRRNAAARLLFRLLDKAGHIADVDRYAVRLTAAVLVEVEALQAFCDQHGTTYEVVGRSGDVYTKHRPEHQQLNDARTRLLALLRELGMTPAARRRIEREERTSDPLAELLAGV